MIKLETSNNDYLTKYSKLILSLIFVYGFFIRLYLVITLPIWNDEMWSIWSISHTWSGLFNGLVDLTRTPGYLILLKGWSFFSYQLFWLRTLGLILYSVNFIFLFKIAVKYKDSAFSVILTFLYSFSGYFVIFDWQVRMYTGVVTIILLGIMLLFDEPSRKRNLYLTLISLAGFLYDYALIWFFVPLIIISFMKTFIRKNNNWLGVFSSLLLGLLSFIIIYGKSIVSNFSDGYKLITWISDYSNIKFQIFYYLGSHKQSFERILLLVLFSVGLFALIKNKLTQVKLNLPSLFIQITIIDLALLTVLKLFNISLFHPRSLQVFGLTSIFLISTGVNYLYKQFGTKLLSLVFAFLFISFISTVSDIPKHEGKYILSFYPWKSYINNLKLDNNNFLIIERPKELINERLFEGLLYTLDGKETLHSKKRDYKVVYEDASWVKPEKCQIENQNLYNIYICLK